MLDVTGWILLLVGLAVLSELWIGCRRVRFLKDQPPESAESPMVSIVVAARNEERNIEEALRSLLRLDYPAYELIVVNDRSEDETGAILERMAQQYPHLQLVELTQLPEDWLGKNHALWCGSQRARGELLLFTDADVVMEPSVLARAVNYMLLRGLDHLTLTPEARMPGILLNGFALVFGFFFLLFVRPWRATRAQNRAHVGIGAFNLVSTVAYRASGGHAEIPLRPDDDLMLGKLLKMAGFQQEMLYGSGLLQVEWYPSLTELAKGLEKNLFAASEYRVWLVMLGACGLCLVTIFPFVALLFLSGQSLVPWGCLALLLLVQSADTARMQGFSPAYALLFPLGATIFVILLLRTTVLNLVQGGITWRGTFYRLEKLRQNRL